MRPARVQGAYVSDEEIRQVVSFLKIQNVPCAFQKNEGSLDKPANDAAAALDEYFAEAARSVIEKGNASIGMLQRIFKIGFNRAARIMDQLCAAGIVSGEEEEKPRRVLMDMSQFENLLKK